MNNRLGLTLAALCGLVVLTVFNGVVYINRLLWWRDALIKGPTSPAWPGSKQLLDARLPEYFQTLVVVELVLIVAFFAAVALIVRLAPPLAIRRRVMPRAGPADTRA